MVKKIFNWCQELAIRTDARLRKNPGVLLLGLFCGFCFIVGGCRGEQRGREATANTVPAAVERYEVPLSDTATKPDLLCLIPGQAAVLLRDIVVDARVPYSGNELYVGKVRLEKGTMLVKPKGEP